jgi:hypothetical protein
MNEIERRTLIGAAGIGALAALSKAGPLDPPSGPVASTGRTLDEVYNRIPAAGGSDGRVPIPGGNSTFVIGQPGSYVLTGNIQAPGTALVIAADDVTLDLNGYTLWNTVQPQPTSNTLQISGGSFSRNRIRIHNGAVRGGHTGIGTDTLLHNIVVEDIQVYSTRAYGVSFGVPPSTGCIIRRCTFADIGALTTQETGNFPVIAAAFTGAGLRFVDNTVFNVQYLGANMPSVFCGLNVAFGTGVVVARNMLTQPASIGGTGISFTGNSVTGVYRDNSVFNWSTGYSLGSGTVINGGGNV